MKTEVKSRLLCMTHLPPPVNGVTMMGDLVVNSKELHQAFEIRTIPFRSADSIDDIGRLNLKKLTRALYFCWHLLVECLVFRPRLVYFTLTPTGKAFYRDLIYVLILKLTNRRRIFHLHGKGISFAAARSTFLKKLYTWVFKGSSIILLSPLLYEDISDFAKREQCFYLPNGIKDTESQAPGVKDKVSSEIPHILFLSNMVKSKGPMVLLEALAVMRKRGVKFKASFAGAWESEAFCKMFMEYIQDNDLASSVAYIGPQYGIEKEKVLSSADIFAFPSYNDTFPLVVLEAMRHGLPLVTTYEGAIPDMVHDGKNGFLVPVRDVVALADRLMRLTTDRLMCQRLGQEGRRRYEQEFTVGVFDQSLLRVMRQAGLQ
jgi:glycosyltransferase involved in cell wall biosynthesis